MGKDTKLFYFKDVLDAVGHDISALKYDKLEIAKPDRRTLERRYNCTWLELKRMVSEDHNAWLELKRMVSEGHDDELLSGGGKKDNREITKDFSQNNGQVTVKSLNIKTLEDALSIAEVDTEQWEVDRYTINSWEVTIGKDKSHSGEPETYTNYQVKVWLKRKQTPVVYDAIESLCKDLGEKTPSYPSIPEPGFGQCAVELGLVDVHLGMLAWKEETGQEYDLKRGVKVFRDSAYELLSKASVFNPEEIWIPIGQDFFHINDPSNYTPAAGNPLDVDSRMTRILELGFGAFVDVIEACAGIAKVKLIWVPGNHDPQTSYYLSRLVQERFRNTEHVEVDCSPKVRKRIHYGNCLVGYTHGSDEPMNSLPAIMAGEWPKEWSSTSYREWHIGHIHKQKEVKFAAADTFNGVTVRVLRSLSAIDQWHYRKGYVPRQRSAEGFVWDKENGCIASLAVNLK